MQLAKSDDWKVEEIDPHAQLLRYRESRVGLVQTPYQLDYAWQCIIAAIKGEHGQWASAACINDDLNRILTERTDEDVMRYTLSNRTPTLVHALVRFSEN